MVSILKDNIMVTAGVQVMSTDEVIVQYIEDESTVSEAARKKRGSAGDARGAKLSVNRVTNVVDVVKDFFKDPIRSVVLAVRYGADKGFAIIHQVMQYAKTDARAAQATLHKSPASPPRSGPDIR
jgi:hypothetical protein